MTKHNAALLPAVLVLFCGSMAYGQGDDTADPADFQGTVEFLSISPDAIAELRQRDIIVSNVGFFPVGDTGAHAFATLDWDEDIGPGAIDSFTDPTRPPKEFAWWDIPITVTRSTPDIANNQGVMVSIDKDVFNNTPIRWTDFHMSVGFGVGPGYEVSDETDFLFFKDDPPPVNKAPPFPGGVMAFADPPKQDDPVAPDELWWDWDPDNGKNGLGPGEATAFWLGVAVPSSAFGGGPTATFTLREHASVPEPGALALASAALLCTFGRRRS